MASGHQNLHFHSEVRWLSRVGVRERVHELREEVELFLIDNMSDLSQSWQDKKWVARLTNISDTFTGINELNLKLNVHLQQYLMLGM
jgi:hypothetical protein